MFEIFLFLFNFLLICCFSFHFFTFGKYFCSFSKKHTQNSPLREKKTSIIIIIMMMIKNFVCKRVSLENFTLILSKHSEITTFKWKIGEIYKNIHNWKKNSVYNAKNIQNQFCSISYSFLVPEKKEKYFLIKIKEFIENYVFPTFQRIEIFFIILFLRFLKSL